MYTYPALVNKKEEEGYVLFAQQKGKIKIYFHQRFLCVAMQWKITGSQSRITFLKEKIFVISRAFMILQF